MSTVRRADGAVGSLWDRARAPSGGDVGFAGVGRLRDGYGDVRAEKRKCAMWIWEGARTARKRPRRRGRWSNSTESSGMR